MARNIKEECREYDKRFSGDNDELFASDYIQVKDIVLEAMGESRGINLFLYTATDTALKAGFMIGYRAGLRDSKKNTEG